MVFHGPSKGCVSCKKRRKKCDQTRPSCLRCTRAHRNCGGYEDDTLKTFRQYESRNSNSPPSASPPTTGRRCTLPKRTPIPGTNTILSDVGPTETSIVTSYEFAMRAFFHDFCIIVTNQKISQGFLPGLEAMAYRLGPRSDLVKACQALSYFGHGRPLNRPHMVERAEKLHQELLGSLATAIEDSTSAASLEARYVAMILGLYEIAAASPSDFRYHQAHAKGLAALLRTGSSLLDLLRISSPGSKQAPPQSRRSRPSPQVRGVFSVPALTVGEECLDNLMLDLDVLRTRFLASTTTMNYSPDLQHSILALHQRFSRWASSRCQGFVPTTVGHVTQLESTSNFAAGCWPGRVDTYFDFYVAGVWNIVRMSQLINIDMLKKLSDSGPDMELPFDCR
ncbi:hypothetical protein FDECE_7159 [Fusarium decemcellulare]|nr:hypothetical protein FDECE_7159 [Fusarium decemcellulare]